MRDLTRYRIDLVGVRTAEKNRVEKLLEDARIKLSVVASDIFGVSGRAMMAALIAGERDPKVLAELARTRMRTKIPQLEEAFVGHFNDHHGFLLAPMLARVDGPTPTSPPSTPRSRPSCAPFAAAVARLDEIPGCADRRHVIIAEIGVDMSRFPTAAHLCSWAKFPAPPVTKILFIINPLNSYKLENNNVIVFKHFRFFFIISCKKIVAISFKIYQFVSVFFSDHFNFPKRQWVYMIGKILFFEPRKIIGFNKALFASSRMYVWCR